MDNGSDNKTYFPSTEKSTWALGYGGTATSRLSSRQTGKSRQVGNGNNSDVLEEGSRSQKLKYKAALDDLQKPLIAIQRPIQMSTSVLDRAKSNPADNIDVGTLERELDHLNQLTRSLTNAEAYMNRYIFTPLAESPEKVSDTVNFHTYLIRQQHGRLDDLQHVAQCFADYFGVSIEDTPERPAVRPGPSSTQVSAQEDPENIPRIVEDLKSRFANSSRNDEQRGRPRGVTQIHQLRESVKRLKSHELSTTAEKIVADAQDIESTIRERLPHTPDKTQILWGRIVEILDNSGGKKIALRLNDILDAATSYAMYSLASGMIAPSVTDSYVERNSLPISMPPNSDGPLEFTPRSKSLTEVSPGNTSNGVVTGDGAAGRTSDDSPVLNGLLETGARVYALRPIANKYLLVVKTTQGDNRTCVVTTKPGNTRVTLGAVPSGLQLAAQELESPSYAPQEGDGHNLDAGATIRKPIYIPLPSAASKPSEGHSGGNSKSEYRRNADNSTDGTMVTTLFNDRIMMLNHQLKSAPLPNPNAKRLVVISGDKRNASIEFLKQRA